MNLAYFAPLPPAPSGVADYAQTLLTALQARIPISVNAANRSTSTRLYHIGNNPLHWEHYQRALREPGVILLHDAVLHHLLLGQLSRDAYVEEFAFNYGEWYRDTAARYWNRRAQSVSDPAFFARPMLRRLAEASLAVLVHNPAAAQLVRAHHPSARVEVIPHFFEAPRDHSYLEIDEYRERVLGVPRTEVLFAVLGHLRETKRLDTILRVYETLRRQGLAIRLLIQGEFVGPDLERSLGPLLEQPGILRRGFLNAEEWWLMARSLDGAINLRWPSAGESSGIATRLLGIAKPVLVTRGPETSALPEVSVVKIDPGLAEREQLTHYWAWLASNQDARLAVGRHGAIHIRDHHSLAAIADRVLATLAATSAVSR
jgi:glycosyltransferase involved in cell wall biosynthesis